MGPLLVRATVWLIWRFLFHLTQIKCFAGVDRDTLRMAGVMTDLGGLQIPIRTARSETMTARPRRKTGTGKILSQHHVLFVVAQSSQRSGR